MDVARRSSIEPEDVPDFMSSRQSTSSNGNDTPKTPPMPVSASLHPKRQKSPANVEPEYSMRPPVELFRTESAACQDELYNPANFDKATPTSQPSSTSPTIRQQNLLSPRTNNLVNERVRIANSVRSKSPDQEISRERSPFRQGSELAPQPNTAYPRSPASLLPSAAALRQQQKEQAHQKEIRAHQPPLRREPTKTISPKDAVLDAPDIQQDTSMSLFSDIIPQGYQKHLGGSEQFSNNFVSGTNQAFGQFVPMNQSNMGGFRGLDLNNWLATPVSGAAQQPSALAPTSSQISDKTPEFPANLTSMESSVSDNPPASSQDSMASPPTVKRPLSTAANTGTYACTNPGCVQRFDSPAKLQRHKRDQHQPPTPSSTNVSSATPEGDNEDDEEEEDDDEDGDSSVTSSSAVNVRNSSVGSNGTHKCTRINPSTGKPCNTIFSRPYDLTRHEDTIHNKAKQKVRCQYCREEKTFSRNDALTRHMRVVHPDVHFDVKKGRH